MNPVLTIDNLRPIFPDLALLAGALLALGTEMFRPQEGAKNRVRAIVLLSLLGAMMLLAGGVGTVMPDPFPRFLCSDPLAMVSKLTLLIICAMAVLSGWEAAPRLGLEEPEYYALLLLSTYGMMALVASVNLVSAFLSLETFSLAMYILAGFNRRSSGNREAALKYFLTGAFAAAFFLFGLAVLFLASNGLAYSDLSTAWSSGSMSPAGRGLFMAGLAMVLLAFFFKVGLVPFHAWVPDTYEGAPTPVSAYLSAAAKVAGLVAVIRLLLPLAPMSVTNLAPGLMLDWQRLILVLALLAGATMTWANLVALRQTSLKRMLAWSSIAHSGFALIGLVTANAAGASATLFYVFIYAFMNFLAFSLVVALEQGLAQGRQGYATFNDLDGLGLKQPFFGFAFAVAAFSLAGLPPTAGFVAKFGLLKAALGSGHLTLALVAVLNSVIAAGYYLRLLIHLYMKPSPSQGAFPRLSGLPAFLVVATALFLLVWGVLPGSAIALADMGTFTMGR